MSRDKLFEHYKKFVSENIHLQDKAFIVLTAALWLIENGEKPENAFEKLDFGLRVLYITQEQS